MSENNFRVRKGLTVEGSSTTTGSATVNGSVILTGSTSGQVNLTAPAVAGSQAYTLPTGLPASNGYVLASQTDGTMSWVDNSAAGTTYDIDATSTTGGANLNLNSSASTTDSVKIAGGTNITVTATDANTITIDGTDLNTTYTIDSSSTTGGANFNLTGSDSTTDTIKLASGGATTVTSTDANTITISSTDTNTTYTQDASSTTGGANLNLVGSDSTTDSIKFESGTNVTVTATDANTITIDATDTNTTYTIDASSATGGANFNLAGSDSTTDTIKLAGSGATTITATDANTITIDSTNTTYTQDASSTTGGANLNLAGSDSTTDSIKFASGTNVTVTATDANTITIDATDTNTTYTIDSSSTTGGANFNLAGSDSTTDTIKFASSGATTVTSTDANTITISSTDTNTTYTQDASSTTGGANLNLVGSDSTTDSIKFAAGSNITVTATDANTITITGTSTGTTYTIDASSTTGGANFNLQGSDSTTDTIKIANGTGVSATATDANTITVAIGQDVSTSADVTFNSVSTGTLKAADGTTALTLANSTGDVTANRYIQVNGNRILNSSGSPTFYFDAVGNGSVNGNWTIFGNTIKSWNGSASANAITLSATNNGDVTTVGNLTVGGNNIKASDGTVAATLATSTGDITFASRLLSSASKTIRQGSNRTTSYASVSGATSEDILMAGIGASGVPINGLLVTNADLPTGSTSGRRPGILIRGYAGNEYNAVAATAVPQPYYGVESTRGTTAEPRALGNGQPIGSFVGFGNAGSDLTSGNTPYWTAQQYPSSPAFGLRTFQAWKGPWGSGAANVVFTATIAAASTNLVVSSVSLGTLAPGQEIRLSGSPSPNWSVTTNTFQILSQASGTPGGAGTYVLNANPGTYTSATVMIATNTTLGSGFFMNLVPNDTPITTASRVTSTITPDLIQFRSQAASGNSVEFRTWATTNYGGTGSTFRQGTDIAMLALTPTSATVPNIIASSGNFKTGAAAMTLLNSSSAQITGSSIAYNRVYGQWQYDATITPAAANTAYAYPIAGGVTDFANIASVANTSQIIPGAAGMYKLQFSIQIDNADNGNDHTAYIWWRKNGTDVPNSMGQVTVFKNGATIAGWDNMISSANSTDYWELMYAVDSTQLIFPYYAATAFGPATASLFVTLVPIGA